MSSAGGDVQDLEANGMGIIRYIREIKIGKHRHPERTNLLRKVYYALY